MTGVFKFEREFYCVVETDAALVVPVNVIRVGDGSEESTIGK